MRYIYVFRNLVNNKVYVGQTINLARRKAAHLVAAQKGDDYLLPRAMRKHGVENFVFEVLEECGDSLVDEREKFWIAHFDSRNRDKGYNLHVGGQAASNVTRQKLSEALKGNKHCVGRKISDKAREAASNACKAINNKHGVKRVVTETCTCSCGAQFEVTFATNRRAHVKKFCSRHCANSRIHSEETKLKISASLKSKT